MHSRLDVKAGATGAPATNNVCLACVRRLRIEASPVEGLNAKGQDLSCIELLGAYEGAAAYADK